VILNFDLLNLNLYSTSGVVRVNTLYKIGAKLNNYWVIDDLARFRRAIIGIGHFYRFSWARGHSAIISTQEFCFSVRVSCCIFNAGGSNSSDVENDAKFRNFWPLWKLGKEWGRSLYQLLKLYLRSNLRNIFDGHTLRGCWARWIDKKRKKESRGQYIAERASLASTNYDTVREQVSGRNTCTVNNGWIVF